jgi:hypothetical protein
MDTNPAYLHRDGRCNSFGSQSNRYFPWFLKIDAEHMVGYSPM